MSVNHRISVIVPVYKVEKYLRRCLDSILKQSFEDFDLVLVDDGSPDSCGAICDEYASIDARIKVLHRENGGLSAARNTGIEWALTNSDSEWITFIDSDDWIHPQYLEILISAVENTDLSVAIVNYFKTENDDFPKIYEKNCRICDTEDLWIENKVLATVAWGKLYQKADFAEIRYPDEKIHEDEHTTFKILFKYDQIALIDLPLYAYFQNEQSIMHSTWSPKHVAECEGIMHQLEFFLENKYEKASAYTAKIYLTSLYRNLVKSREAGEQYGSYSANLKKQLQKGLTKYGRLVGVNIENSNWMYYEAYPVATIPYRAYKKLIGGRKSEGE